MKIKVNVPLELDVKNDCIDVIQRYIKKAEKDNKPCVEIPLSDAYMFCGMLNALYEKAENKDKPLCFGNNKYNKKCNENTCLSYKECVEEKKKLNQTCGLSGMNSVCIFCDNHDICKNEGMKCNG